MSTRFSTAFGALLLTLAFVSAAPVASASDESIICGVLPLWDAAMCHVENLREGAERNVEWVRCDVVGGPVCDGLP